MISPVVVASRSSRDNVIERVCAYLGEISRRAHPKRDRSRGRLSSGLVVLMHASAPAKAK